MNNNDIIELTPLEWNDPILFDNCATPEIPASLLPGILGEFAAALTTSTETPQALAVMSILGVISAAAAKWFKVSPKDGWAEPLNIYALVALPPANNKTQVLNKCIAPLIAWERKQREKLEPEIKRQYSERKTNEKIIESLRSKAAKTKNAAEQKIIMDEISEKEAALKDLKALPSLFTNDATPESLATNIHEQGGHFTIFSDEGGIMEVLSGLYSGGNANIDILLKGIDGGHVRVRRRDRSFDLNPFLTIFLTVQPAIIQNMGAKKAYSGNGILERFLYVIPQSKLGYRTHNKPSIPDQTLSAYHQKITALLNLAGDQYNPSILTLSDDAFNNWSKFQAYIETQLRPNEELSGCLGWGGKICGFTLRLAGLLHVAEYENSSLVISPETMAKALEIAALLTKHAIVAYGLMGVDQASSDAQEIFNWIKTKGESFTKSEILLAMKNRKLGKAERLGQALAVLIDRNIISQPQSILETRKPTTIFHINPAIFKEEV